MTLLAFGGFEAQDPLFDGLDEGGPTTFDTSVTYQGGRAAAAISATGSHGLTNPDPVADRWYYLSFWMRVSAAPDATQEIVRFVQNGTNNGPVSLLADQTLYVNSDTPITSSPLPLNTWTHVELGLSTHAAGNHSYELWVNGFSVGTGTKTAANTGAPTSFRFGRVSGTGTGTYTLYLDDWQLNDETGAANNGPAGPYTRSVLLSPVTDSAIGSDWTLGDGTAVSGNAYDSVNNTPPVGVSDASATAGSQLRNAVASVGSPNADADFTLETPNARGVTSETILSAQVTALVGRSASVTTLGTVSGVSNPAITGVTGSTNLNSQTHPVRWADVHAFSAPGPTVNPAVAPVLRMHKATATTNALLLEAVGMYLLVELELTFDYKIGGARAGLVGGGVKHVTSPGGASATLRGGGVRTGDLVRLSKSGGGIITAGQSTGGSIAPPPLEDWVPPFETEVWYSRLAFLTNQRIFQMDAAVTPPAVRGSCGWHGTRFDPERGAVAIARVDGPFARFVGERLKLTYFKDPSVPRSVVVYVLDERWPVEDLTIPRAMFLRLSALALDQVTVVAEVLA